MDVDRPMYSWRRMTPEQRKAVLEERKRYPRPWHGPPHYVGESGLYLLYRPPAPEHRPLIGVSPQRMAELELELVKTVDELTRLIVVWALLPNHYHVLVDTFGGRIRCQESFVDQCRPLR